MKKIFNLLIIALLLSGCEPRVNFKANPDEICAPNAVKSVTATAIEITIECMEEEKGD